MKKLYSLGIWIFSLSLVVSGLHAQNVAINNSGNAAYVSAILDLSNHNTVGTVGFLPPYVTFALPLSNFQISGTAAQSSGMIVYNTGGANPEGLYYWDNTIPSWVAMGGGESSLTGAGTLNYYARWTPNGTNLGIGFTEDDGTSISMSNPAIAPIPSQMLTVTGNLTSVNAIVGNSVATGGAGVLGTNVNPGASGGYGVEGLISGNVGGFQYAVYGASTVTAGNGIGVWGQATGGGAAINYGGYFNANGGATNYGIIVPPGGGNVGLGTITPAQQLEVGNITSTIRNDGIKLGNTYYSTVTPPTSNSSVMFVNNSTGDEQALAPGALNSVLVQTATGIAWGGGGSLNNIQVFTAGSGNYTPTAGTTKALVVLIGGGGGGAGSVAPAFFYNFQGVPGGAGAGGMCIGLINPVAGPYAYVVGAAGAGGTNAPTNGSNGGTTTLTATVVYTANGGNGAATNGTGLYVYTSPGANGGTTSNGLMNITGQVGGTGMTVGPFIDAYGNVIYASNGVSGYGGSTPYGTGGASPGGGQYNSAVNGNAGYGYGAGGSSGYTMQWGTQVGGFQVNSAGGNGAGGLIIVYEYK